MSLQWERYVKPTDRQDQADRSMTVGTHSDRLALLPPRLTADPLGLKPSVADRLESCSPA